MHIRFLPRWAVTARLAIPMHPYRASAAASDRRNAHANGCQLTSRLMEWKRLQFAVLLHDERHLHRGTWPRGGDAACAQTRRPAPEMVMRNTALPLALPDRSPNMSARNNGKYPKPTYPPPPLRGLAPVLDR